MPHEPQNAQVASRRECTPAASHWMLELPIYINGHGPYTMSVDTGAGLTIILPELAEELGLKVIDTEERRGVGGAVSIDIAQVQSVIAEGMDAKLETIGVSSFPKLLCGDVVSGNIGYDVLRHGRLTADFANRRAQFEPSGPAPIDGSRFVIASAKKPLIVVETSVGGKGPYSFIVDTGAMGTCIAPQLAELLGVKKGEAVQAAGVGGTIDAYFSADALSFRIGDRCSEDVMPVVLDVFGDLEPETGMNISGIIGRDILQQYTVTVDYPHSTIRFV